VLKAPDLGSINALAASIPELRSETRPDSLALLVPFLSTLLEFRSDR